MMNGGIRIRKGEESDIAAMIAIEADSFPVPWSEQLFWAEFQNPIARVLIADLDPPPDQPVVGYIVYWQVAGEMQLHTIAVRKDQRRKGIAAGLLGEALGASRAEGGRMVTLEVRRSNQPAQRLYERFGFSLRGVRRGYYTDNGEDGLIFGVELDPVRPAGQYNSGVEKE